MNDDEYWTILQSMSIKSREIQDCFKCNINEYLYKVLEGELTDRFKFFAVSNEINRQVLYVDGIFKNEVRIR